MGVSAAPMSSARSCTDGGAPFMPASSSVSTVTTISCPSSAASAESCFAIAFRASASSACIVAKAVIERVRLATCAPLPSRTGLTCDLTSCPMARMRSSRSVLEPTSTSLPLASSAIRLIVISESSSSSVCSACTIAVRTGSSSSVMSNCASRFNFALPAATTVGSERVSGSSLPGMSTSPITFAKSAASPSSSTLSRCTSMAWPLAAAALSTCSFVFAAPDGFIEKRFIAARAVFGLTRQWQVARACLAGAREKRTLQVRTTVCGPLSVSSRDDLQF